MATYESKSLTFGTQPTVNAMSVFGWIIIQQKTLNSGVNWNLWWGDYVNGFGSAGSDFWFGLERMHLMTASGSYRLRIEVQQRTTGKWFSAEYSSFTVDAGGNAYRLRVSGFV